jgi:hypothetical protein
MGEARRRRQYCDAVAALLAANKDAGSPTELSARQAGRLLTDQQHITVLGDADAARRLFGALAQLFGSQLGLVEILAAFDPAIERPSISAWDAFSEPAAYRRAWRQYPALLIGFIHDTVEHRILIDSVISLLAARQSKTVSRRISHSLHAGPIVLFDDVLMEAAACALSALEGLSSGRVDDLSLN